MRSYICLDSSVLIKLLVREENSDKAALLIERVLNNKQTVVLPSFAWAEIGSVLRKKISKKMITLEQAEIAWESFSSLGILEFIIRRRHRQSNLNKFSNKTTIVLR
ncbi:type II toxin-antitoxin system VapC family toxin [Desulforamulus aeronauticus]|uniref:PIN domain-containing protein n=1 Tax=Desulforamulus aeronauticus DSM 10349 TaxID=1121421 RepID=A0A1M6VRS0_9FIRM|nr:type II toxin-antitoxin system VapC family toxin [Desulforamulus aeronauticus]SHK84223.1 PIN domain-containing protein [Desulforamulus aeronauticus DSM 10349]